ncbi:MAG: hypothetical protein AAGI30_12825 [Planctomycetota bacterium]
MTSEKTITDWLLEVTATPTAAGREHLIIEWVTRFVDERPALRLEADRFGNLTITHAEGLDPDVSPLVVVAHMDHPGFVVEEVVSADEVRTTFRGGVLLPYFNGAPLTVFTASGQLARATVLSYEKREPWGEAMIRVQGDAGVLGIEPGDLARWEMPDAEVDTSTEGHGEGRGVVRTPACDNLASVVGALAMLDRLVDAGAEQALRRTSVLLTRAEEVGFVGAICACRDESVPPNARFLVLENSRSFPDSPIGGGVILRVGDRVSVFSPAMTAALGRLAVDLATETKDDAEPFRWQRKLMPGGACEASVFCAYGYESACLCLPLGNYHNMAALDEVQAGDETAIANAACAREFIALDDFFAMVRLLERAAHGLDEAKSLRDRLEQYYEERRSILENDTRVAVASPDIAPT